MAQVDNIIGYVKGPQGDAASISVGNVSTGAAGSSASVTNRGTSSAAVLDFTIPKGEKGDAGTPGVSSYASASEAGLVRAGDDVIVNSSNGILSLNSNNITEPSDVTNLISGDSYRTILGKIKKFISTFSSNNFLINALTSSATDKALTANMGRALANNIATIETSSTASRAYSIGEHLIYGGQLYTVTAAIASGGTLTVGSNIIASRIADELTSSNNAHAGDIANIEATTTASRNYTAGKFIMLGNQLYKTTAAIATGATLEVGTNIEVANLGDQISSLNDSLDNFNVDTPMSTSKILTRADQITKSALATLETGCYLIQCASKPSDFLPASAYGVLFVFGSMNNYRHAIYSAGDELWKINFNGSTAYTWKSCVPTYTDVSLTVTAGQAIQINNNSGGKVNYTNFINCYVVGTNDIVAQINTYSNLLYVKFLKNDGTNAPAGTYTLRCWYYPS